MPAMNPNFDLPPWIRERAGRGFPAGAAAPAAPNTTNIAGSAGAYGSLPSNPEFMGMGTTYSGSPSAVPSIPGLSDNLVGKYGSEGKPMDQMIKSELAKVLQGGETSYSPERVAYMKAQAKSGAEGAARGSKASLNADLIRRGMGDSGEAARSLTDIERQKDISYSGQVSKIAADKSMQDFQDKMAALDRSQKNIDDARSYVLGLVGQETQQKGLLAQLATATMQVNAQKDMLKGQLDQQQRQFGMNYDLSNRQVEMQRQMNFIPVTGPDGQTRMVPTSALNQMGFSAPGGGA